MLPLSLFLCGATLGYSSLLSGLAACARRTKMFWHRSQSVLRNQTIVLLLLASFFNLNLRPEIASFLNSGKHTLSGDDHC